MFATLPREFAKLIRVIPLSPDARVFGFILGASLLATLVFGLVPAIQATSPRLMQAARGDFSTPFRPARLRNALVIGQVTICALLLIVSGVLLRGARRMQTLDVGLATRGVIDFDVDPKARDRVIERLASEPWVEAIAAAWRTPLYGTLPGIPVAPAGADHIRAGYNFVSPEFFAVFRIPVIHGRNFTAEEANGQAAVTVISEATARRFWPNQDAIGQSIRITPDPQIDRNKKVPRFHSARVIGIARDVASGFIGNGLDPTCLYFPTRDPEGRSLLVRVKGDTDVAARRIDAILTEISPGSARQINPMDQVLAVQIYPFRAAFWVSSMLGGLALLLTVSGIYGVLSYLVSQRTKEIGIRMALGASTASVVRLVFAQSMKMTAAGTGMGVLLALGVSRLFASILVMMNTFDAWAYAGGAALVLAAAAAASFFPTVRAVRVDPVSTLRCD